MTEDATFWRMEAERHAPAPLGTIGQNTISRAELGAYGRRHGWGRDTAGAVADDIVAHREPAAENATPAATPPPVAADLTPAQCDRLDRMVTEYGDAIGAVRQAVDLLGARIHSAEDARIIAAARDALRVLEGAETPAGGPAPGDTGRVLPTLHGQAREHARGKDGSEDGEREAFVRQYRVLAGQEDPEVVLIGWCAEAIGCLFQRTFDGTGLGVTLGELTDAAAEHEGEQGERAHAYLAEINGEGDEP